MTLTAPMTTVLHVIGSGGPGGGERHLLDLIRYSSRAYRHVTVIPYAGYLNREMEAAGHRYQIIPMPRQPSPAALIHLCRLCREAGADVIHSHGFRANFYGRLAALLTRRPHVVTIHVSLFDYRDTPPALRRFYRIIESWSSRITRRFICVSEAMAADTRKLGISPDKIIVIYNGIDPVRFSRAFDVEAIKMKLGITGRSPVIGTVGRLVPEKGQVHLIRALPLLKPAFPDLVCLFAGEGPLLEDLKREAMTAGVADICRFTGSVDEIEEIYAVLDLFVLPSVREPFGLSALEAMASGVAVLATNSGGPAEYIRPGINGLLVPPEDPSAMAEAAGRILSASDSRKKIAGQGHRTVLERFDIRTTVASTETVYDSLKGLAPGRSGLAGVC
ncbi:MAG: glycosyltransferase family 4 protein [Thermodesulfobacteriota bacterium]